MWRQRFGFAALVALGLTAVAIMVAVVKDLPFRDPDGVAGPTFVRLPAILALAFLTDVVPRTIRRCHQTRSLRQFPRHFADVTVERWPLEHIRFALLGLGSWYLTYVAFRNLKSYVPFVNDALWDASLTRLDRAILFGHDPAVLLHQLLGTGWAAHAMSVIYIAWIALVPVSLAAALVWSRNVSGGAWLVTAVAVDWVLGVATYFVVPTLGPIYARPHLFDRLPETDVSRLQAVMIDERNDVLANPFATDAVQTIAAFASLHVGITVTVCVIAHLLRLGVWFRVALWVFLVLTILSTIYLGWHYLVDAFGGIALGVAGAWIGAIATGNHIRGRPVHRKAPQELATARVRAGAARP
ncbi:MAG TPA: phosphatase PAP2 family protein [Nocardioidaceae bacterium]|nr:phosphatase PAP2 family protein [Nocardioidaceae bacterium]